MEFVIVIFVFLIFVAMGISAFVVISKTNPSNTEEFSDFVNSDDTKSFLLHKSFEKNAIDLGLHQYRSIIEVSSLNYDLMTEGEQNAVDMSYEGFINSLTTDVCMYVQTKVIDNTDVIKKLDSDIEKTVEKFPQLQELANTYRNNVSDLHGFTGNSKQKKKYIIVSYNNANTMESLNDEEKKTFSLEELHSKTQSICDNIQACGVKTKILEKEQIAEVLYSALHRNTKNFAKEIISGAYSSLVCSSQNKTENVSVEDTIMLMMKECENKIDGKIDGKELSLEELRLYKQIVKILHNSIDAIKNKDIVALEMTMKQSEKPQVIEIDDLNIDEAIFEELENQKHEEKIKKEEEEGFVFYGQTL